MLRQLLSAVEYCHGRKVWHRDLKLENVLLMASSDEEPDCAGLAVKVADFGFSKRTSQESGRAGVCYVGGLAMAVPLPSPMGGSGNCCTPQTRNVGTVGYMVCQPADIPRSSLHPPVPPEPAVSSCCR